MWTTESRWEPATGDGSDPPGRGEYKSRDDEGIVGLEEGQCANAT